MKNLIFVALIVSVMLVLSVGGVFAAPDDGYYPADKNEEAKGSTSSSVEAGGEAGGSGGRYLLLPWKMELHVLTTVPSACAEFSKP